MGGVRWPEMAAGHWQKRRVVSMRLAEKFVPVFPWDGAEKPEQTLANPILKLFELLWLTRLQNFQQVSYTSTQGAGRCWCENHTTGRLRAGKLSPTRAGTQNPGVCEVDAWRGRAGVWRSAHSDNQSEGNVSPRAQGLLPGSLVWCHLDSLISP